MPAAIQKAYVLTPSEPECVIPRSYSIVCSIASDEQSLAIVYDGVSERPVDVQPIDLRTTTGSVTLTAREITRPATVIMTLVLLPTTDYRKKLHIDAIPPLY